jgi:hypothetical protein
MFRHIDSIMHPRPAVPGETLKRKECGFAAYAISTQSEPHAPGAAGSRDGEGR